MSSTRDPSLVDHGPNGFPSPRDDALAHDQQRDVRHTSVIFDLGGVLVDWDPRYLYRKLLPDEEAVEWFLSTVTTPEWNGVQDWGRSFADAVAVLTQQFPQHADLIEAYDHRWIDMISGQIEGTVEILRELRTAGSRLYALTNWSAEKFPHAEQMFDWLSWFDGIVVSGRESLAKPDPRIYRLLLERYQIAGPTTLYIDDNPPNVHAANVVGMTGVHFTGPEQLRDDITRLGLLPAYPA
jgi:2-haloacid dehalogenase